MVCPRCIKVVERIMTDQGLEVKNVILGEVELIDRPSDEQMKNIVSELSNWGFERLKQKDEIIVVQIKSAVLDLIHYTIENTKVNNSTYLSEKLNKSYAHLSQIFSRQEKITLEKYIILQKIEKVKELLSYDELKLREIAAQLGYSSVQYLSNQFKSIVGMSVRDYKKATNTSRTTLDKL